MGKLPLPVLASGLVHVALVVWLAGQAPPRRTAAATEPARSPIELVDVVPIEVALVDPPLAAQPTPVAASQTTRSRFAATSRVQPHASHRDPGADVIEPVEPKHSPLLSMRGRNPTDLTLPARFRDELAHAPAGTPVATGTAATGKLAPDGTGFKSDQGPFVAHVDRDGSVTLRDRPDVSVRIALPSPKLIGRAIAEWYLSDKGPDGKRGKRTLENYVGGSIDPADRSRTVIMPILRGGLGIDDWLSRRTVGDPYASKKLAYLDATRDERVAIGAAHRRQLLQQTAILTRQNLERAWARTTDPATRKRALFELWDEIVESDGTDELLVEASRSARAQIIGFIRAHLPRDSKDAYTADELAVLARRKQSRAAFAPYD